MRALVRNEVQRCNASLPAAARIRRFLLLNKELDADDNEITRTRKVRRRFIAEKYRAVIEALYGGASGVRMTSPSRMGVNRLFDRACRIENAEDITEELMEPAHA